MVGQNPKRLGRHLLELRPWGEIITLARSGVVPTAIIAREEAFRIAKTLFITRYTEQVQSAVKVLNEPDDGEGWPLVNNLIDTGAMVKERRCILPKPRFAFVDTKPKGLPFIGTYSHDVEQDVWVFFQLDRKLQYVRPLADDGA